MSKQNSFIYINLNSMIGKYAALCLIIGNVTMIRSATKTINKFKKSNTKENNQ